MIPLPFSFPLAGVFWAVFLWAFGPEWFLIRRTRRGARRPNSPDAGSLRVILTGQLVALAGAFPLAFLDAGRLPARLGLIAFWFGVTLIVGGSLLRRHCRALLGQHFTVDVRVEPGQVVVTHGAYRWVRHPSYLAGLLMFAGIGFALGSWASLLLLTGASLAVYSYRMPVEERALETALGDSYRAYKDARKRLIPFLY